MYNFSKDGIVVSTVLDARTANKEGKYPIKIKVYYQRKPKYYSIGICMTKEEWMHLSHRGRARLRRMPEPC